MDNLCSRICSFPQSIPNYFITKYSREGEIVFDMWSGKGSVPFEAVKNNRIGIGNDKSPEAYVLTHAKVRPVNLSSVKEYLNKFQSKMARHEQNLGHLDEISRKAHVFYGKKTFQQILKLREFVQDDWSDVAIFTKAIVLGLLHGNSQFSFSLQCSHSYSMSPAYVKQYAKSHHLRRPHKDIVNCILGRAELILQDSPPKRRGFALMSDSRHVPLPDDYVHLILSSPPYFDIQTYAWCNWLRLWFLGHDYRKVRGTLQESGSESSYRNFMRESINELYRVLKPGRRCFIVVGDVTLKGGKKVNTAEFLAPLCTEAGFKLDKIVIDRVPRGRRVMTYIPPEKGIKTERILYLIK